jgi:hypothetical protein
LRAVPFAVATCLWHVSRDAPQGRGYNNWRRRHACRYRIIAVGKAFRHHRSGQTLSDNKGIVPERFKEFAQHL